MRSANRESTPLLFTPLYCIYMDRFPPKLGLSSFRSYSTLLRDLWAAVIFSTLSSVLPLHWKWTDVRPGCPSSPACVRLEWSLEEIKTDSRINCFSFKSQRSRSPQPHFCCLTVKSRSTLKALICSWRPAREWIVNSKS